MNKLYMGVVVDRDDPLMLGRVRVRVLGLHSAMEADIANSDLPWAVPIQPTVSAANSGIGWSATGLLEGTWCVVIYADENEQVPLILGTVAGQIDLNVNKEPDSTGVVTPIPAAPPEDPVTPPDTGETPPPAATAPSGDLYLGSMTKEQYDKWKAGIGVVESGSNYKSQNSIGYSGKYQFGVQALEEFGYLKAGTWARFKKNKILLNPDDTFGMWTGKNGCNSTADWLANTDNCQEVAMDAMVKKNYNSLTKKSWFPSDVTKIEPHILGGLLAVAHNQGVGGVNKLVAGTVGKDGYGTGSDKYYWYGYNAMDKGSSGKSAATHGALPTKESLSQGNTVVSEVAGPEHDENSKPTVAATNGKSPYAAPTQVAAPPGRWAFRDPNGRYPLASMHGESDTNRLARGQNISKTCVGEKEETLDKNIGIANSSKQWQQSPVPYAAKYPHNNVYQSESGHVMEFDDTEGAERIHLYHTAGTFWEIDKDGNSVLRIVGNQQVIVDETAMVHIMGDGHVALDGDLSVKVSGQCQIEVHGDANIKVEGNSYQTVKGSHHMTVDGNYNVLAKGEINMRANGRFNMDGNIMQIRSNASVNPDSPPDYSPEIVIPQPPNRQEAKMVAEEGLVDHTNPPADIANAPPPVDAPPADTITPPPAEAPVSGDCESFKKDVAANGLRARVSANIILNDLCNPPGSDRKRDAPPESFLCSIQKLALNIIEPLLAKYKSDGMFVTSCWRPDTPASQHAKAQAVDLQIRGRNKKRTWEIAKEIAASGIPYDQCLLEYRGANSVWIHISHNTTPGATQRRQVRTMLNDKSFKSPADTGKMYLLDGSSIVAE